MKGFTKKEFSSKGMSPRRAVSIKSLREATGDGQRRVGEPRTLLSKSSDFDGENVRLRLPAAHGSSSAQASGNEQFLPHEPASAWEAGSGEQGSKSEVQFLCRLLEEAKQERLVKLSQINELERSLEMKANAMEEYMRLSEIKSRQVEAKVRVRNSLLVAWQETGTALSHLNPQLPLQGILEKTGSLYAPAAEAGDDLRKELALDNPEKPPVAGVSFYAFVSASQDNAARESLRQALRAAESDREALRQTVNAAVIARSQMEKDNFALKENLAAEKARAAEEARRAELLSAELQAVRETAANYRTAKTDTDIALEIQLKVKPFAIHIISPRNSISFLSFVFHIFFFYIP
jgi:hypothetical protein